MTDTIATRTAPPPLTPLCPDCSICGTETRYEDGGWRCDDCCAWWDESGLDTKPGEWDNPDTPQCEETIQPHLNNHYITDPEIKTRVYRCLLDAGHDGNHGDADMWAWAKGWH